ncbi:MAG: hypothetical protein ACYCZT_13470 [Thiobacillus sp.]
MAKTMRWNRSEDLIGSPDVDTWPHLNLDLLPEEIREAVGAKVEAVTLYVRGVPLSAISARTGVTSQLSLMTKRCLDLSPDGQIWGFRALAPYFRIKGYERRAAVSPKRQEQMGGHAGALGALLSRFPYFEKNLIALIKKEATRTEVPEHRIRPKDLHRIFISMLRKEGLTQREWPFNTKYLGIRSIQRYMKENLDAYFDRAVNTREESSARAHLAVGKGEEPLLGFEDPFDAVEIDAYSINALFSVAFQAPEGGETEVLLERLWLIAAIDRASTSVLAYNVVYSSEVSADDVLKLFRDATGTRWTPKDLTVPGMTYPSRGGLPSGVFDECMGAMWGCVLLDGALVHLSKAVYETARKKLGFILNWGPVGHFERRPNIERLFSSISEDIFMRYPSTTGSNPGNGRSENAELNAIRYRIHANEAEELVDLYFAQFNATPSEGLSFRSPLEFISYFLTSDPCHFMIRHLPRSVIALGTPLPLRKECVVRGGRKQGRHPYIEFEKGRYTSQVLAQMSSYVGRRIIIEADDEDIRQVRAYLPSGEELGFLKVTGRWAATKHSRKTRKAINRLTYRRILVISEHDDPVRAYMAFLSKRRSTSAKIIENPTPRQATEAARLARESGLPLRFSDIDHSHQPGTRRLRDNSGESLMDKPMPDINLLINKNR